MKHIPLEHGQIARLSAAAQKALGAGPGRSMASRGMMPLPPAEQVVVLYQLSLDPDHTIASAARATAVGLPEKLVAGTLADPNLPPLVLDFFATLPGLLAGVFDAVVMNPACADDTVATLANKANPGQVDLIAENEQRLLRHPEIIAAMYTNKKARMSTVDRVVELAVRNHIRVPGLACWDEIARSLSGGLPPADSEVDALFAYAADALSGDDSRITAGDPDAVPEEVPEGMEELELEAPELTNVPIGKMSIPSKIRLATIGNAFARSALIRDPVRLVALAAIKSPGVTDAEAALYARNPTLPGDVISYIASQREWTKLYGIKVSLCRNPKTPVPESMRLITFLRDRDLNMLGKSRGVPSALVAQARKLSTTRRGGDKKP